MLRELAGMVATGAVTSVALVEHAYERIGSLNEALNAVIALRDAEKALAEAGALDERARRGERLGPLAGVPFLVKDNMDVAGLRTTHGSLLLADAPPAERDGLHVARLCAAGAVPIGKTNVPEFCFEGFTSNRLFGTTANPWAPEWSPGGSSGGSAAALAAGMVPLATATDGGGSIRIPASFCGLYGLKPTNGLVPRDPIPAWLDFSTDGPLALGMDDLRLLLSVVSGPADGDPTALPADAARRVAGPAAAAPRPALVLAAPRFVDWGPLPAVVGDLFDAAVTSLEGDLGLAVEPVAAADVLGGGNADEDWFLTGACEQARALGADWIDANADSLHPAFLTAMREGLAVSLDDYLAARRRRFEYVRALDELLGADRLLVTPTMPVEGYLADGRMPGAEAPGTPSSAYNTQVQNMTGHPALSVPAGCAQNGVPFGLQITGPRFADQLVLTLGDAWEAAYPRTGVAPGYDAFWPVGAPAA